MKNIFQRTTFCINGLWPSAAEKIISGGRVLYWECGKAVFQSVTAYGTEMKLLTVDCEKLGVDSATEWSRINNFDFKNKMSIMVPGLTETPKISCIQSEGTLLTPNTRSRVAPKGKQSGSKKVGWKINRNLLRSRQCIKMVQLCMTTSSLIVMVTFCLMRRVILRERLLFLKAFQ